MALPGVDPDFCLPSPPPDSTVYKSLCTFLSSWILLLVEVTSGKSGLPGGSWVSAAGPELSKQVGPRLLQDEQLQEEVVS